MIIFTFILVGVILGILTGVYYVIHGFPESFTSVIEKMTNYESFNVNHRKGRNS